MGLTVAEKIINDHLVSGKMKPGEEISISVDQTLTQDATGTMAYLEFETLEIPRVKTGLSVSYIDHNTLRTAAGYKNAEDHHFLQSFAAKYGIHFSKLGNGICHQVHLERFGRPGAVLIGSDSHTPTAGGLGMLGIGVGGLEVAAALAGRPYSLRMPEIFRIRIEGELPPWVSAKDVALFLLKELKVFGGVGRILEYSGPGIGGLSVPQRATITNMGTETGATSSIFSADERTRSFLRAEKREADFRRLAPDADARYSGEMVIDLSALEPLIACPHSPDNVRKVSELAGEKINQVCIGSCTNSSLRDLMTVAAVLRGKNVHPEVQMVISPGSRQVLDMITRNGSLSDLTASGARILDCVCGPCIGIDQAPAPGGVSLRTYNRNFRGRSGTWDADVYLVSPEVAVASALSGCVTDPRELGDPPVIDLPGICRIDDSFILKPSPEPEKVSIVKGPNISSIPPGEPLPDSLKASVWLKAGDNLTTDAILPAGAKVLPLRSNIEKISRYVFRDIEPEFVKRSRISRGKGLWGVVLAEENYGQGSSREHAALAPRFLGVRAVLALSFARIHKANLINFGILPLRRKKEDGSGNFRVGDEIEFPHLRPEVEKGGKITIRNLTRPDEIRLDLDATRREKEILLQGGLLNLLRTSASPSRS